MESYLKHPLGPKMRERAKLDDLVISTRIRLARNLKDTVFSPVLSEEGQQQLCERIEASLGGLQGFEYLHMGAYDQVTRQALVEKHLISPTIAAKEQSAVFLSDDETISVLINEEDHLRIQTLLPGYQVEEAFELARRVDALCGESLPYAFDEQLGYLTTCPSNIGTGLRASVMLHLPGLTLTGRITPILKELRKLGYTIRGRYGEGSDAAGRLFQLSNQRTLGSHETQLLTDFMEITEQVIQAERQAREELLARNQDELEDQFYRSYGILRYAKLLSSTEAVERLSDLHLASDLGILSDWSPPQFHELIVKLQSGFLQKHFGKTLSTKERDRERATLVRRTLDHGLV
ncbi:MULTISPECIES: protein arginine kinase [Exiguobacterium]|jgi:protein arginine kinase|uniref:Protein-arginine kinase n=2 Tax=Exiguobacterium TaxID=33986 RepID=U1LX63_9BACL|nr:MULTISPECIES: protein arginine kinase [Exiguobacterium]ERG67239.1 ATP:guanido phosphotransferase [Exiguobacterium chiriqhucha RW-2]KAB2863384.1 MAG: protein arginine kinase [Exiguobacterium chiriqhucha]MDP0197530.1 protein arginine kinase [Glaesserella parasuis]